MLSLELQRYFSQIGARLKIRTDPKGSLLKLALREDEDGQFFLLALPRLSRNLVRVQAVQPRRTRLLLRLGNGEKYTHVLVRTSPKIEIRTLKRREAKRLLTMPRLNERPKAA
jgi:hypothetical protein